LSVVWVVWVVVVVVEIASKLLLAAHYRAKEINPLDYCYNALQIQLEPLVQEANPEWKLLEQYAKNTGLDGNMRIENIYRLQRRGEPERFQKWRTLDNHFLLWHGSHSSNYIGILSQGLRIAPPAAPVSGYAFGKGVYFADMLSKSYNYCRNMGNESAFLLLSEVALGKMNSIYQAMYMEQAPEGMHSTKGIGRRGPDFAQSLVLPNGVQVPLGAVTEYPDPPAGTRATLQHNEYIVYDESQCRMRYIVQISPK
jgi:poly [ADP-ribose] polymerase 1